MSRNIPAENAMDCLGSISELLENINPTNPDKPVKLKEDKIRKLITLTGDFEFHKKRIIIISATSYFEERITKTIHEIYERLDDAVVAKSFFKTLFEMKYHQLFDFDKKLEGMKESVNFYPNASRIKSFFRYLGDDFSNWQQEFYIDKKWNPINSKGEKIIHSIECFLLLNSIRNKIVHGGYNAVDSMIYAKDSESFYKDFENACEFIEWLPLAIEESEKWGKERRDKDFP